MRLYCESLRMHKVRAHRCSIALSERLHLVLQGHQRGGLIISVHLHEAKTTCPVSSQILSALKQSRQLVVIQLQK